MNGSWKTVWDIAAQRNETKLGESHLSDSAFEVLQDFVMREAAEAMANALGHVQFFRLEG